MTHGEGLASLLAAVPGLDPREAFRGTEHLPFLLEGGRPAALLVHGFPGTPAEMWALGESLHSAGWTVQGLLLPGFGADLASLDQRSYADWLSAVEHALHELGQGHSPLLLVGYSMGAALATAVAARNTSVLHPAFSATALRALGGVAGYVGVDGLILLAPFVWEDPPLQRWFGRLLRPLLPRYFQPFRLFDLSNPQARHLMANLFPRLDLDDVHVREQLRQVRVPLSLLDQVRKAGQGALESAPRLSLPTLVVVGKQDELASPARVQPLLRRIHPAPAYLEVEAAHGLTSAQGAHWPILEARVLDFARDLQQARRTG
jgi:carboxylesterase